MLNAFSGTELPLQNVDQRRRYMSYITHSQAASIVSDIITRRVTPFLDGVGNDPAKFMKVQLAVESLRWPLKIF